MKSRTLAVAAALCSVFVSAASAQVPGLSELPTDSAVKYGGYITDIYMTNFKKDRQVKFDVDVDKTTGYYTVSHGFMVVPAKGLSESQLEKDAKSPNGAPLCNLYLGRPFTLLVDGKSLPDSKLRFTVGLGNNGEQSKAECFLCTVHQAEGGERELYLFGAPKEPVLKVKFKNVNGSTDRDLAFTAAPDAKDLSGTITIFGEAAASISIRYTAPGAAAEDATTSVGEDRAMQPQKKGKTPIKITRHAPGGVLQFDLERSGFLADGKSLPKKPRIVWKYPGEGKGSASQPSDPVVDNGVVYFGDEAGQLHALNSADGSEKWSHDYGPGGIAAAPAVVDHKVYVASTEGLRCVSDQTGETVWNRELPKSFGECSPLPLGDAVIVGCGDGFVRAFNRKTGEPLWESDLVKDRPEDRPGNESQIVGRGEIAARMRSASCDGTILVQPVYDQCRVVGMDCRDGKRRWATGARGWIPSHAAIAGNNVVFGSWDIYVHCVNRLTGQPVWKFAAGAEIDCAPAIGNGRVYITCRTQGARLHCIDLESGNGVWMHRLDPELEGRMFNAAPFVTEDTVYIASNDGFLTALDAQAGSPRWSISVGDNLGARGFAMTTDGKRIIAASRSTTFPAGASGIFAVGD